MSEPMRIWIVYERPTDYPDCYVARLWENDRPTPSVVIAPDLQSLRALLTEMDLVPLARHPTDDPVILETWL